MSMTEQMIRAKTALARAGLTITTLARETGYTRQWTSRVMYGHEASPPARAEFAKRLRARVATIWPDKASGIV